uniref:RING-type domain-containing protein n=1 Tax=viral metagenome TaxID=1070528 RepID=A0A6C0HBQ7_9ZZZZ
MFSKPIQQPSTNPKDQQKSELANRITEKLKKNRTYFFRPIAIDGILCYPVIYGGRHKIVNFESIHINCFVKKGEKKYKQKYSLFFQKYKTILGALNLIEDVVKNYKIYNGDLVSKEAYELMKLEEAVVPYTEDQRCCVCNDDTTDITLCKHHICLQCREQCILNEQLNCPVCRKEEIINMYCNETNLINNSEYQVLQYAFEYEDDKRVLDIEDIDDNDSVDEAEAENHSTTHISIAFSDEEPEPIQPQPISQNNADTEDVIEINYNARTPEIMIDEETNEDLRQRMQDAISYYSHTGFQPHNGIQTTLSYNITNVTLTRGSGLSRGSSRSSSPNNPVLADILEEGEVLETGEMTENNRYFL